MKECRKCGKRGFFLRLDATSWCVDCQRKEAQERNRQKQAELDAAKSFIRQMAFHISEACEHSTILPSWGAAKIHGIREHCQYVLEHIDDWKKYKHFYEAFNQTLLHFDHYTASPLFPDHHFQGQSRPTIAELFKEVAEKVSRIESDCIMAEYRSYDYSRVFKVVGVTFKNGNKSRQTILRKIRFGDPPFDSLVQFELVRDLHEGQDAVTVLANGEIVGHISKDDLPWMLAHWNEYYNIAEYDVLGGNGYNYGLDIRVGFRRTP